MPTHRKPNPPQQRGYVSQPAPIYAPQNRRGNTHHPTAARGRAPNTYRMQSMPPRGHPPARGHAPAPKPHPQQAHGNRPAHHTPQAHSTHHTSTTHHHHHSSGNTHSPSQTTINAAAAGVGGAALGAWAGYEYAEHNNSSQNVVYQENNTYNNEEWNQYQNNNWTDENTLYQNDGYDGRVSDEGDQGQQDGYKPWESQPVQNTQGNGNPDGDDDGCCCCGESDCCGDCDCDCCGGCFGGTNNSNKDDDDGCCCC